MTSPLRNLPVALRLIFLFCLIVTCAGAFGLIGYLSIHSLFGIAKPENVKDGVLTTVNDVNAFLYMQTLSTLGAFVASAFLYARLVAVQPIRYLGLGQNAALKWLLLATLTIIIVQPLVSGLIEFSSNIDLPASMQSLRSGDTKSKAITKAILNFSGVGRFILVALVVAVLPAIAEEILFRGVILGDLLKAHIHPAIAIGSSGILFAMAHSNFNHLLAIFILGCFLGYLYYASGNLWVSITAHFTNNFFTVLLAYLYNNGMLSTDLAEAEAPLFATLISVALFAGCIFIFNKWKQANSPVFEPEEMDLPHQSDYL